MEIGTDEIDELDDFETEETQQQEETPQEEPQEDYIDTLLKSKGIEDRNKIKFEDDNGEIEERSWDDLSNNDKVNILQSSEPVSETGLDSTEVELINAIRQSGLSPSEYLQNIGQQSVNNYVQNSYTPQYIVDDYSDDDLYKADLMSRTGISEEEAQEELDRAKTNETLFQKQIQSIRNEYKTIEQENAQQAQAEQEQYYAQQQQQFNNEIVDQINNFTEFSGYDLNLENEDMQMLYDFITGTDAAGNNYFAKALTDPKTLVQAAWLTLNGQQMIEDITHYFQNEISNVRKESYKKGVSDAQKQTSTYVSKGKKSTYADDLDDF